MLKLMQTLSASAILTCFMLASSVFRMAHSEVALARNEYISKCGGLEMGLNDASDVPFPWLAKIIVQSANTESEPREEYGCGGTLLHPEAVLTSAHCVKGKIISDLMIEMGQSKQRSAVRKIEVHQDFDPIGLHNDLAVVYLSHSLTLGPGTDVMCIPQKDTDVDRNGCFAAKVSNQTDVFKAEKLELPIVDSNQCQDSLKAKMGKKDFQLHESTLCAGGLEGRDTCQEDSGGPLVCPLSSDKKRFAQVGVVSWGIGCGAKNVPGVYTNLVYLAPWIRDNMQAAIKTTPKHF